MNRSIRFAAIFALLLTVILMVNLTRIQVFSEERYAQNGLNKRQFFEMKSIPRGQISTGGLTLAHSVQGADGFYQREYVTNPVQYGPVEGYLSDIYGASGIESSYNGILNGDDPSLFAAQWKDVILGREKKGANVELTLVPEVQDVAYQQLSSKGYVGAVVAIRPKTGEVLAMASTPSFNPSSIVNPETAENSWAELTSDSDSPLLNHATQETLPPGSTFKVITTAAGLANGYSPDSQLNARPEVTLPGTTATLENYGGMACAPGATTSLTVAFTKSCNTAFVEMGIGVGTSEFNKTAEAFGVGESYDLGVPMVAGTVGEITDDAALGQSSIGQRDVSLSVLQNAVIAATVANGGKRMNPHIVSKVVGQDLKPIKTIGPKELNQAVSPEVASQITELMKSSERNTAGYSGSDIASKTGTAEHGEDSRNSNPHAWYIAFGPSQDADVAVAVVVKNGGDRGQQATGGSVAAPIGRAVIDAALRSAR